MHPLVLTIGHSTRTLEEFLDLLAGNDVHCLVDIRAYPGSRRLPHFGQDLLPGSLQASGIDYVHLRDLGGRRRLDRSAPATWGDAWRNSSFRAYAQHAQTATYRAALEQLLEIAAEQRAAIMCSESVPWRCHRWLVSDTLVARGAMVHHVIGPGRPRLHEPSPFAQIRDGVVTWPGPESTARLHLGPPVPLVSQDA